MAPDNKGSSRGGAKSGGGRGGRGNRSKGKGGGRSGSNNDTAAAAAGENKDGAASATTLKNPAAQNLAAAARPANAAGDEDVPDDEDVCFICANTIAYHSITPCNHSTCHICGLRMRALYKDKNCAHCRTASPYVIFSADPNKKYQEYTDADISTTDSNIGIKYAKEDIVGDTVLLLRYNCPSGDCDFAGLGWPDLHRHVRTAHKKRMCDLCTRNKRLFTHEHELFGDRELERHMRRGDDQPGAADQTGFKGHPLCGFCGQRFYDDDKLYEHCRMKHERCFLCDRRDSRQPHYYLNYDALEDHFRNDHFLCADGECLEKKFVVFESELDLQAHRLEEHGGKVGTAGREARVVDMSGFDIRQTFQPVRGGRNGGRSGGRNDGEGGRGGRREGGGRGRDQNAEAVPFTTPQPLRRDEIAFQRQMAIHSAQSVSNRTFGGQLTSAPTPTPAAASASAPASRSGSGANTPRQQQNQARASSNTNTRTVDPLTSATAVDPSNMTPEERARLVRHGAVIERASNLVGNDATKLASFREYVSSYRRGSLTAPQLIDSFFTLFSDTTSGSLGTLVKEVADLYDDVSKADALRAAWQDWRAINEDYPSLPGLSGMHGQTSTSSGWASAGAANPAQPGGAPSQRHSNRVLKLKNSTRLGGPGPAPTPTVSTNWVTRASGPSSGRPPASSAAAFPSLPSAGPSRSVQTAPPRPPPAPAAQQQRRPAAGADAFPSLPAAPKPTTTIWGYGNGRGVRRDYGGSSDTGFQWGNGSSSAGGSGASTPAVEEESGQGKKGKKKKVLVAWG